MPVLGFETWYIFKTQFWCQWPFVDLGYSQVHVKIHQVWISSSPTIRFREMLMVVANLPGDGWSEQPDSVVIHILFVVGHLALLLLFFFLLLRGPCCCSCCCSSSRFQLWWRVAVVVVVGGLESIQYNSYVSFAAIISQVSHSLLFPLLVWAVSNHLTDLQRVVGCTVLTWYVWIDHNSQPEQLNN